MQQHNLSPVPPSEDPSQSTETDDGEVREPALVMKLNEACVAELDHLVPTMIRNQMRVFRAAFDANPCDIVPVTVTLTAHASSKIEAQAVQYCEAGSPPTANELVTVWRDQTAEQFASDVLPLQKTIDDGGEPSELDADEIDARYLAWLETVREIRVKIRPREDLAPGEVTRLDRSISPISRYHVSTEVCGAACKSRPPEGVIGVQN